MTYLKKFYFPYDSLRDVQKDLIKKVDQSLSDKSNLLVHAPTGLGKTAATLCPAIKHAIENDLTVFFLTSRHTQHLIAIETLQQIKEKFNTKIIATEINAIKTRKTNSFTRFFLLIFTQMLSGDDSSFCLRFF